MTVKLSLATLDQAKATAAIPAYDPKTQSGCKDYSTKSQPCGDRCGKIRLFVDQEKRNAQQHYGKRDHPKRIEPVLMAGKIIRKKQDQDDLYKIRRLKLNTDTDPPCSTVYILTDHKYSRQKNSACDIPYP